MAITMQSKFGRSFRHRSKPMICRKPPPPGPTIAVWPPPIASALLGWFGANPYNGNVANISGLAHMTYHAPTREYVGNVYQGNQELHAAAIVRFSPPAIALEVEYWGPAGYETTAFSYNNPVVTNKPIDIRQTNFAGPYPGQTVRFYLYSTPLV